MQRAYLVTVVQVLPFALALIRTPPVPSLLHFGRNNLPQAFVSFGLSEILLQLSPDSDKVLGFLIPPLRDPFLPLAHHISGMGDGRVEVEREARHGSHVVGPGVVE